MQVGLPGSALMDSGCLDETVNEAELKELCTHCPVFSSRSANRGCQVEAVQLCHCVY